MSTPSHRLSDEAVRDFIIYGYLIVEPDFPPGFHENIYIAIEKLIQAKGNVGNRVLEEVPDLTRVFEHPQVKGALESLLGEDMVMHQHRHCHTLQSGKGPGRWHQDDVNVRHHQIRRILAMYYPQEVTEELGPTVIMPGTQFRNAPTSRMASYGNFRHQKLLTVKAGTVVIAHYDLWHSGTANRGNRNRHMLKFIFDRVSEPVSPAWDHDPSKDQRIREDFTHTHLPSEGGSDAYKQAALRFKVWNWLQSGSESVHAGASEETIITHYR
ncbi:MAG: phytanoyl-CoA dioxygenase family protein [Planctomycetes bacterium]|nr:phytanoyl-CoA dioxygenase family protein [Planctomycetota bacterium]